MTKKPSNLPQIVVPDYCNYIGVFLTFGCNMGCDYCINKSGKFKPRSSMKTSDWIKGLNRLVTRPDLPLTLGGGEPTTKPGFYKIVNSLDTRLPIDILTNGIFDEREFSSRIPAERLRRKAKYASIRFSYHPGEHDSVQLLETVAYLKGKGYSVGVWAVDHPDYRKLVRNVQKVARNQYRIDFRLKEFLGVYEGELYGTYAYPGATNALELRNCQCRTSEILIGPRGYIYRCHRDLYAADNKIGHLLDSNLLDYLFKWSKCTKYGECNECDVKSKFNRYQESGHCSVEIRDVHKPLDKSSK